MDLNTAIDVIESVAGFADADTSVGEAWAVVMAQLNAAPAPAGEVGELVRWLRGAKWDSKRQTLATRAAGLLERQAVPVAVSERPWEREGWCDSEGRCWIHCPGQSWDTWVLMTVPQNAIDGAHCLPATALPLPGNTESGGCND